MSSKPVWYRSLYWRVGLGFVAFLGVLLVAQALLFVWLASLTAGAFPAASGGRLAELIASDIQNRLASDPAVDLGAYIASEYGRVVQPFVVVMKDGRTISNRQIAPLVLLRNTRTRLATMRAAPLAV